MQAVLTCARDRGVRTGSLFLDIIRAAPVLPGALMRPLRDADMMLRVRAANQRRAAALAGLLSACRTLEGKADGIIAIALAAVPG